MSARPCSFQIQPPVADALLRGARVHPEPEVYARMAAVARGHAARRFALCRYLDSGVAGSSNVFCEYLGWAYRDGVTVTDRQGRPIGWYSSIDAAHHYLTDGRHTLLWLVWLEPSASFARSDQGAAGTEAAQQTPDMFCAAIGFMACGPADARLHTMRLIETAESFLPEMQRHLVSVGSAGHGFVSVFCPQHGCVKPPQHPGDHDIPAKREVRHEPPATHPSDVDAATWAGSADSGSGDS